MYAFVGAQHPPMSVRLDRESLRDVAEAPKAAGNTGCGIVLYWRYHIRIGFGSSFQPSRCGRPHSMGWELFHLAEHPVRSFKV